MNHAIFVTANLGIRLCCETHIARRLPYESIAPTSKPESSSNLDSVLESIADRGEASAVNDTRRASQADDHEDVDM
ncbi:hypothetical protein J6590_017492 [Homalodisca vitripennis]|nr:hypothetical protein J6590_017492 [Homalodisca vitripennis]